MCIRKKNMSVEFVKLKFQPWLKSEQITGIQAVIQEQLID
jgi:hypothetical protein